MGEPTCQWCDGAMTAEARGRYTNPPEDGPDAWAAAAGGGDAALRAAQATTADIVRRHYPAPPVWVTSVTP